MFILIHHSVFYASTNVVAKGVILLVRRKTIVFGRTYVLRMMFFLHSRNLRDARADWCEILHDGQY